MFREHQSKIRKAISRDRLEGYFREVRKRQGDCGFLEALAHYSWNMVLSQSFYPSLQTLEVSLRNAIQNGANQHFNNPWWFENPSILDETTIKKVSDAKKNLKRQNKNVDPGRILAELNFGFWTSLFYARYENTLWRPLIKKVFPQIDRRHWNRKKIAKRLNGIRKFRNRIFHYEPIWYFDLEARHTEMIEAIGWIEPSMVDLLSPIDPFPQNFTQDRLNQIKANLKLIY